MAKKKRRGCNAAPAPPSGRPASRQQDDARQVGETDGSLLAGIDVELVESAVRRLCRCQRDGLEDSEYEALSDALRPVVLARASRYEEDQRAAKLAEVSAGNANIGAKTAAGVGVKRKQQPIPEARGLSDESTEDPMSSEDLASVAEAAKQLVARPEFLNAKVCKPLRSALHPLVETHLREEKSSATFRITCALSQRARWPEALRLLNEMCSLEAGRRPKLGAYQRWVREVNAAHGSPSELAVLDAVMRVAAGMTAVPAGSNPAEGSIRWLPPFRPPVKVIEAEETETVKDAARSGVAAEKGAAASEPMSVANKLFSLISSRKSEVAAAKAQAPLGPHSWSVVAREAGPERQPPNHYDLDIYMCKPGTLVFNSPPQAPVERHYVPAVEGAFALTNVFSGKEVDSLRSLTEAIGYRPDVPLTSKLDERAQNVVLMATEEQNQSLFDRVKHLLPPEESGDKLLGLNRRWRIYRYLEGNAYRKHLDGAWPSSGMRVDADGRDEYVYDAYAGSARSRYTFIMYLNEDCEGGHTTYFIPSSTPGVLHAQSVQPTAGSVTVFPHGDTGTPLLHEGSPVTKGSKYLLRTEVVYAAPQPTAAMREAKRLRGLARQLGGLGGQVLIEEAEEAGNVIIKPLAAPAAGSGKSAKVVKKRGLKSNKFKEKQKAKLAKMDAGDGGAAGDPSSRGRGGQIRMGGIGKRPKKNGKRR